MVTELRVYFEGDKALRPGFHRFLSEIVESARSQRCRFQLVEANGTPMQDFRDALETHTDAWNVLLLDSEDPQEAELRKRRLEGCDQDSIFWMVQTMEAWFLADVEALRALFKKRFNESALGWNPRVEEIPKADVMERLKRASGGEYHKVNDGLKLLQLIDPAKVRKAAPNCERMFNVIPSKLS
jgi:Domain of unknown function (DUF4276)